MKSWIEYARGPATAGMLGALLLLTACSHTSEIELNESAVSGECLEGDPGCVVGEDGKLTRVETVIDTGLPPKDCQPGATCEKNTKDVTPAGKVYKYLIGPGDNLTINVWRNADLSSSAVVRPDGMITIPLIEDLPVSDRTPTQIARDIENLLASYVKDPLVTVTVTGFVGPYSEQIRVVGEATNPQALPYRENMTLLDLMIAVGGLTDFAAGNRAVLVRIVQGEQKEYRLRLEDLVKDGDISANAYLQPGDILIIPESWF